MGGSAATTSARTVTFGESECGTRGGRVAQRVGNLQMAQVHARTGWSRKELARRVNQP